MRTTASRKGLVLLLLIVWSGLGWALPLGGFAWLAWSLVGIAGLVASQNWSNGGERRQDPQCLGLADAGSI